MKLHQNKFPIKNMYKVIRNCKVKFKMKQIKFPDTLPQSPTHNFSNCLSREAHGTSSPLQEGEHVQAVKSGQTQKHLIDILQVNVF